MALTTKILFVLSFLLSFQLKAQTDQLTNSLTHSPYTYIFKINAEHAKSIYRDKKLNLNPEFFYNKIDSFPTHGTFSKKLEQGHYLKAYIDRDKIITEYSLVSNFKPFIYNNNKDLLIKVHNKSGNISDDVTLTLNGKDLNYNNEFQAFIDKHSNRKGVLEIKYNGFTAFYQLDRSWGNSWVKRLLNDIAYNPPLNYVWEPVNFLINIPIDGYQSIKRGYSLGTIRKTSDFAVNTYEAVMCLFNPLYCKGFDNQGFTILSKPKYKPKDTLRLKSIVIKGQKLYNKPIELRLESYNKTIFKTLIRPYRKGAFETKLYLHDSLNLKLDSDYKIGLYTTKGDRLDQKRFSYEDYVLSQLDLKLNALYNKQYKGQSQSLSLNATDDNGFPVLDGQLEIVVLARRPTQLFLNQLDIKDTLWKTNLPLKQEGETTVEIPNKIFPKANFKYQITAILTTSDNQYQIKTETVDYSYKNSEIDFDLKRDSLAIRFNENAISIPKNYKLYAYDRFYNKKLVKSGTLPDQIKITPYYSHYRVEVDSLSKQFKLNRLQSQVTCYMEKTKDSLFVKVNNPLQLKFDYFIYEKNKPLANGQATSLDFKAATKSKQNFYVNLAYLWGGEIQSNTYTKKFNPKSLFLDVEQPSSVYPGDTTTIKLKVTTAHQKPAKFVDITAHGLTKNFNYRPPSIKSFDQPKKPQRFINTFKIKADFFKEVKDLDNTNLNSDYGLDSLAYYQFMYPKEGTELFELDSKNHITQFSPFVVNKGKLETVQIIYIDHSPVYFHFTDNQTPYSFKVDSTYHKIGIRTKHHLIEIDSVKFKPHHRSLLSIDVNAKTYNRPYLKVKSALPYLSPEEKNNISPYLLWYNQPKNPHVAYLQDQQQTIHLLRKKARVYRNNLLKLGPIRGDLVLKSPDQDTLIKFNFKPLHQYYFKEQQLILEKKTRLPQIYFKNSDQNISFDEVLTEEFIASMSKQSLKGQRKRNRIYTHSRKTEAGKAELSIVATQTQHGNAVINYLVINEKDSTDVKLYRGSSRTFYNLEPSYYKLITLFTDNTYSIIKNIHLKPYTKRYIKQSKLNKQRLNDNFSIKLNQLINQTIQKKTTQKELQTNLINTYQNNSERLNGNYIIKGQVTDQDGLPLPGANVIVQGTTYGTQTDFDGNFALRLPYYSGTLIINYLGFKSRTHQIRNSNFINIALQTDAAHLDEVVVTGYSSSYNSKHAVFASNTAPNRPNASFLQALSGQVAGLSIVNSSGQPGASSTVMLRGTSSISSSKVPLIIINGKIYNGDFSELPSNIISNVDVLKGAAATSIYGNRGAKGVILITTTPNFKLPEIPKLSNEAPRSSNSIRSNFKDLAIWKPQLKTDENGEVEFNVVFPDDVTQWNTHYFAVSPQLETGQTLKYTKAYKPLMGQLETPRFLIKGDQSFAIGKAVNYLNDSVNIRSKSLIDNRLNSENNYLLKKAIIDSINIRATKLSDSLKITYSVEKTKGNYLDGEAKFIPVFKPGITEQIGQFFHVKSQQVETFTPKDTTSIQLTAFSGLKDLLEAEINTQINYEYNCNEQLAAKLKALLAQEEIYKLKNQTFTAKQEIKKIIRKLFKNQKRNYLWGWFKNSTTNYWVSLQVIEALSQANRLGYQAKIDQALIKKLLITYEVEENTDIKLYILQILTKLEYQLNYKAFLEELQPELVQLHQKLKALEILSLNGHPTKLSNFDIFKAETSLGGLYYQDTLPTTSITNNTVQNTLLAYRVLRHQTSKENLKLEKIRAYLINQRHAKGWRNTYESAQIIQTLLPDVIHQTNSIPQRLSYSQNGKSHDIENFPATLQLAGQPIQLSQNNTNTIFVSLSQTIHKANPKNKSKHFEIRSHFKSGSLQLSSGSPVKLNIVVDVKQQSNYVLINIPIPGGCDYTKNDIFNPNEAHREYYKERVSIFCETLPKGQHEFTVELIPRFTGKYTLNPVQAELMYAPVINGHNELKTTIIK